MSGWSLLALNATVSLDPRTGKREVYRFPGKYRGPHSIELSNDNNMWFTLCSSGEMAKLDLKTKKYTLAPGAENGRRGSYPHTLRINPKDPEGLVWYTDAGRNSCFSIHPETLKVKEYHLLSKSQAVGAGKGESRGITPYGIDFSPVDGTIWYSKLNGNRIGGDGDGTLPGPVTLKLMRAFIDLAGMDFVAQALEMLSANEAADSLAEWRARLAD